MTRQEVLEKYSKTVDITEEEFEELLYSLKLLDSNCMNNAQILCHGAGERGVANLHNILDDSGLKIKRDFEESNNWIGEGILSTNVFFNDEVNDVDVHSAFNYRYNYRDQNGNYHTIVTAIPLNIGDITLGKIVRFNESRNCVLDDVGIEAIPKEFILGVIEHGNNGEKFRMNPNFFMLSKENYKNAYNSVNEIFAKSEYGSAEEYYAVKKRVFKNAQRRREMGLVAQELPEYQLEAIVLNEMKESSQELTNKGR